jgi:hypothetical protein
LKKEGEEMINDWTEGRGKRTGRFGWWRKRG